MTFAVAERLDVGVTGDRATATPITRAPTAVSVTVTNMGSGHEAFDLTVEPSAGVSVGQVAIDVDGDGRFDPATDRPLAGETPVLAPGEVLPLVAVVVATDEPVDGTLAMGARARTGSGETDLIFPSVGDGGVDAIVGPTGAFASVVLPLVAGRDRPALRKDQTVLAPDGSARPVSGAIVSYTLIASLPGSGARDVRIEDPVPAGSHYVANSLTLDGSPLSDAADADAGDCDGRIVAVALGTPTAAATRTITFQVRLP